MCPKKHHVAVSMPDDTVIVNRGKRVQAMPCSPIAGAPCLRIPFGSVIHGGRPVENSGASAGKPSTRSVVKVAIPHWRGT